MASVQIQLVLDGDKGVITGLRAVGGELDGLKTRAATGAKGAGQAIGDLDKSTQRSIDSARLLENTLGVALPRTLTKIISRSEGFGKVLSAAFNVSVVAALGAAVVVVGGKIAEAALEVGGYTKAIQESYAANLKFNSEQLANLRTVVIAQQTLAGLDAQRKKNLEIIASQEKQNELTQDFFDIGTQSLATVAERVALAKELLKTEEARNPVVQKEGEFQAQIVAHLKEQAFAAQMVGLQGFAAINEQARQMGERNKALRDTGMITPAQFTEGEQNKALMQQRASGALATKNAEETRKLNDQVVQGWLSGVDLIVAKEQAAEHDLEDLRKHGLITVTDLKRREALLHEKTEEEITAELRKEIGARLQIERSYHDATLDFIASKASASLQGSAKINADLAAEIVRINVEFQKATERFGSNDPEFLKMQRDRNARVGAAQSASAEELKRLWQDAANQTLQIQEQAALAMVPPWERADAEIAVSAAQRIREINSLYEHNLITQADVAGRTAAVWQEAAGKVLDSWTSAFEDLFNGGFSKRIENLAKQFMARIAAQLTLQSGLAGILGPMLGLPSGMPGMTNAGFGAGFGGSTLGVGGAGMAAASGFPLLIGSGTGFAGGASMIGTRITPFLGAGTGGGTSIDKWLAGAPSGTTAADWIGAQPSGTTLNGVTLNGVPLLSSAGMAGGSGGGGLFSLQGLASMIPMGAGFLGSKLGGMPGAIGAGALGAMMFGPQAAIGGLNQAALWLSKTLGISAGAAAGLMVGVGSGALGFGIGQNYGTAAGMLSGAGSGLLVGLAIGLPGIGTIIAGVLGLLGGLFGGLFGGSKRQKQADTFVQQQETAATQIEAQFKSFQLDYPTALTDLEQIRTNAYDQLRQLKDEGKKAYSRTLSPYIDKIEAELKGYEDERERRSTLAFAPPQFASGGYVSGMLAGWRTGDGGISAIVHPGEYVVNSQATAKNRGALEAMNAGGGSSWSGDLHVHGPLIQANRIDEAWLRNGGAEQITLAIRRARLEGRSAI